MSVTPGATVNAGDDLVVDADHERRGDEALPAGQLDAAHSLTTATLAGARYGAQLLWALLFSALATMALQEMAARLEQLGGDLEVHVSGGAVPKDAALRLRALPDPVADRSAVVRRRLDLVGEFEVSLDEVRRIDGLRPGGYLVSIELGRRWDDPKVLAEVDERGPLLASELTDPRPRSGDWWDGRSVGRPHPLHGQGEHRSPPPPVSGR